MITASRWERRKNVRPKIRACGGGSTLADVKKVLKRSLEVKRTQGQELDDWTVGRLDLNSALG